MGIGRAVVYTAKLLVDTLVASRTVVQENGQGWVDVGKMEGSYSTEKAALGVLALSRCRFEAMKTDSPW